MKALRGEEVKRVKGEGRGEREREGDEKRSEVRGRKWRKRGEGLSPVLGEEGMERRKSGKVERRDEGRIGDKVALTVMLRVLCFSPLQCGRSQPVSRNNTADCTEWQHPCRH